MTYDRTKPTVLVDCDGVLSDFDSAVLEFIYERTGKRFVTEDITQWDVFECLDMKHLEDDFEDAVNNDDWCLKLPAYEGAELALNAIRTMANVFCVTAPHKAIGWPGQRGRWLMQNMGFSKKEICQTHAKYLVRGDVFVDDNVDNVIRWKEDHPDGMAIVWNRTHNQRELPSNVHRMHSWVDLVHVVKVIAKLKAGA